MKKLYELARDEDIEIDVDGVPVIFGHVDGMYSLCWRKDDPSHYVHLSVGTELEMITPKKYKTVGEVRLPVDNVL